MTREKGKKLNLASHVKDSAPFRSVKLVMPECQVPVAVQGKTEYTTGPCQQAVKNDKSLAYKWFKTCTHGPEMDSEGNPIPENLRPYYETNFVTERTPVVQGGVITEWRETVRYVTGLRIRDIAWATRLMGGFTVRNAQLRGAKDLSEFGIAQFCEMRGCFSQDVRKFKNGYFCSEMHAKLVKAEEGGEILELAWDAGQPRPKSAEKRREQLARIEV